MIARVKKIFTYTGGKARCRKGVGMELALMVLLVVTACSILMVSTALVARDSLQSKGERVTSRLTLDQLAEYALEGKQAELTNDTRFSGYAVYKYGETNPIFGEATTPPTPTEAKILIITDTEGNTLLTVEETGGKITGWIYG